MSSPSLQAKKTYFAKARRANYSASLRLEGFVVEDRGVKKYASREAAVLAHTRQVKAKA